MFNFHKNHKNLVLTATLVFVGLSILIAIIPAYQMQDYEPLPNQLELSKYEKEGLKVYVAENCMACHTQQVRNIEMDKVWGSRPSIPSDYYYSKKRTDVWRQSPSLLGSERTGPDLTNVGKRQPGKEWHLLHLYNPRSVVEASIMPSYPWLFKEVYSDEVSPEDVIIPLPEKIFNKKNKKVIATEKAIHLVAYLQSLKQTDMPNVKVNFIPSTKKDEVVTENSNGSKALPDGEKLYTQTCVACHQQNGTGIPGAFPPLAGSSIVNDDDFGKMIRIIMEGYDARSEYGQMPGFAEQLNDAEIAAIANHERTSWGNKASLVTEEDVKKIREYLEKLKN